VSPTIFKGEREMKFNKTNKQTTTPVAGSEQLLSAIHRKEISDRLKIADKLLKEGNLDEAKIQLDAIRAEDPKNGYVLALEERREELQKARDNPQPVETPENADESSLKNEIEQRVEAEYLIKFSEDIQKVEQRLEAEYHNRFMEEISKGEQRIREMVKEERERHDAERAALIENFNDEKENLLKELKKEARKLLDIEFKKVDDSYQKQLADKVKKAEENVRVEISALHEKTIAELKEAVAKEKSQQLDMELKAVKEETKRQTEDELQKHFTEELAKERKALIEETKKQMEDELQKRFMEEIAKEKLELKLQKGRLEGEERNALQTGAEEKPEAKLARIEEEIKAQRRKLEEASEERYKTSIKETRDEFEKAISEGEQDDSKNKKETDVKPAETQKEPRTDFGIKPEEQLAKERQHLEKLREKEFRDIQNGVNWRDRPSKRKG
jgi:hypothetical protein